jgi:ubiquinone biosynthesis protein Coq4
MLGLNVPQVIDMDSLRSLPAGSFGRSWADFLIQHQLQAFATGARRKQLHDGIHVLTGYDTDPIGEAEVQAFLLGAKFHAFHIILLAGLLRPLRYQMRQNSSNLTWREVRSRLRRAYDRGCQSHFDVDAWQPELLWEQSLERVRTLARLV